MNIVDPAAFRAFAGVGPTLDWLSNEIGRQQRPGSSRPMASDNRKSSSKTARVLIVDDDPGQRSLLDSFLRGQGFETVLADSGERALEILRTERFSLMIS